MELPRATRAGAEGKGPKAEDRTETINRDAGSGSGKRAKTPQTPEQKASGTPPGGPDEAHPEYDLLVGDPDRYRSEGEHARGGLGRVLKARDRSLGRTVAIKELLETSAPAEARFVREALITARLQHPGIVPVHEAGRWPGGDPYYVMKLISGRSLKELIRDRSTLHDRLALLPSVIAVAETIAYAHSEGVIHRDIKPANVVVGEFGETVVVDWGIAKDRGGLAEPIVAAPGVEPGERRAAVTAGVLGTPAYMPPEQASGGDVNERADVYALGALLYEVLAGEQPYSTADSGDVLSRVIAGPPPALETVQSQVPSDLLAIVRKAMARDPMDRYRTAKELAEDLKRYQTGQLVSAHDYSTMTLFKRWMWRNRAVVGFAAVALGLVAVLGAVAVNRIVEERNVARTQRAEAQAATAAKEKRRRELVLLQAKSALVSDPTATVAWLETYPEDGPGFANIRAMVNEAEARGVARHVFRLSDWGQDAAFSPDSTTLAVVGRDRQVHLFDVATGEGRLLGRQDASLHAVAYTPDGRQLVTGTESGVLAVWPLPAGEPRTVSAGREAIYDLRVSPAGDRIVTIADMKKIQVWDLATLAPLHEAVGIVAASDAGGFAVESDYDSHAVALYDVEHGTSHALPALPDAAAKVAVANGGSHVAALGFDGTLRIIDLGAAKPAWHEVGAHKGKVDSLQFSPSGKKVLSMGYDQIIHVFPSDGSSEPRLLRGHDDAIYMVAFARDESFMVSAGDDGTVRIWDTGSRRSRVLRGHDDDVFRVAVSPDGKWIASVGLDSEVRIWPAHLDEGRVLEHGKTLAGVAYTPDGQLVTLAYDGSLRAWTAGAETRVVDIGQACDVLRVRQRPILAADGQHIAGITRDGKAVGVWSLSGSRQRLVPATDLGAPVSLAFAPEGRTLLATYRKGAVVLWNIDTRTPRVLAQGEMPMTGGFSPDGREVAIAHAGGVTVWSLTDQKVLSDRTLTSGSETFHADVLQYSQDGRWLAVVDHNGLIALLDRRAANLPVRWLHSDDNKLMRGTFSPDGNWIAAGTADRTVRLWRTDTGAERVLRGHTDLVLDVAFDPASKMLASASYDKTVRLWDLGTGESRVLRGHTASVDSVAFSPDGTQLASASRDGSARLWDVARVTSGGSRQEVEARMRAITTAVIGHDNQLGTPASALD